MSFHAKMSHFFFVKKQLKTKIIFFWQEASKCVLSCLILDASSQTQRQEDALVHSEAVLLGKRFIYSREAEAQTETKTDSIPQTSRKLLQLQIKIWTTVHPFEFGWWVGAQGGVTRCLPAAVPCSPCLQPLILTADANSLKNVPT